MRELKLITLLDNLKTIVVGNGDERDRLPKVLKKHGVIDLLDGGKIGKVVVVQ